MTLPILLQLKAKFLKPLFRNYPEASISPRLKKFKTKLIKLNTYCMQYQSGYYSGPNH